MTDWIQLFTNYWWIIAAVIAFVFIVTQVHNFFRFFTTLVSLVALFYVATIIFIPPSHDLPTKEISKVLGVSSTVEENFNPSAEADSTTAESTAEGCPQVIKSQADFQSCLSEWTSSIKMPDFKAMVGDVGVGEGVQSSTVDQ